MTGSAILFPKAKIYGLANGFGVDEADPPAPRGEPSGAAALSFRHRAISRH
jgi:hypothetical protein